MSVRSLSAAAGLVGAALASSACAQGSAGQAFDYRTWDQYLGGGDSSQFSSLDQINRGNVSDLEVAWTYPTDGNYRFNPIVIDGRMYVLAHDNSLVALDAATGEELWRREIEGQIGDRGINHWASDDGSERRLFFLLNGMLTAVDASNGETITSFGDNGEVDLRDPLRDEYGELRPLQTGNPGRVYEDLIIMSLPASGASYESAPADIQAYNVRTGELEWVFHTVPRPGEPGADTWPEEGLGEYGGVHNWSESTIDTERGILFVPTGTGRYDFYGGNRHGRNLYGNSLLAIDASSGELLWHFQTIHHDLWDRDLPQAPKLLSVEHEGEQVDVVALATKQGLLFVFERETGEPLWPIEERSVPESNVPGEEAWPTQPFPTKPEPFARMSFTEEDINPYLPEEDREQIREMLGDMRNEGVYTPPSLEGSVVMPGHNGGTNWGGGAVDPGRGLFVVVSKELPTPVTLQAPGESSGPFAPSGDVDAPGAGEDFVPYSSPVSFWLQDNGLAAIGPPWSQLTAYDLNTGEIMWQVPNGNVMSLARFGITGTGSHAPRGGPVVTGGGLVFIGTSSDRRFRARDVDTGEVLWEHELPAAQEGVPAVYEIDGRQYVTIPVGGNGLFAGGLNLPEPGPGQYMTFALPEAD